MTGSPREEGRASSNNGSSFPTEPQAGDGGNLRRSPGGSTRSSSPSARRGRPRNERTTELILDSAVQLLMERGYRAVSIEAVAGHAGVGKPTIYVRWKNRHELLLDTYRRVITELEPPDLGSLHAELRWLLEARAKMYATPGADRLLAGLAGAASDDESFRVAAEDSVFRLMEPSREILRRGVDRGEVRPDVDVDAAATLIASPLIYRHIFEMREISEELIDALVELLVRAVGTT